MMRKLLILGMVTLITSACVGTTGPNEAPETTPSLRGPSVGAVPSAPVSTPTVKPKVAPKKILYVQAAPSVRDKWGLEAVVDGWNKAQHIRLVQIEQECPLYSACVTVKEGRPGKYLELGEMSFGDLPWQNEIILDKTVSGREITQSTLCHEVGHLLGLGHLIGSRESCMMVDYWPGDPILPTATDLYWLNSLGPWGQEKAYESMQNDVDIQSLPG